MPDADIYLDSIDPGRYWPHGAGVPYSEAREKLKTGQARWEDYPFLSGRQAKALELEINAEKYIVPVPMITVPQPVTAELIPLNMPDSDSLVLVTGNNRYTIEIMTNVWAQGNTPAYMLMVDCLGNTVDMAMVYGVFTPERLQRAVQKSGLEAELKHRHMMVPGLTAPLAGAFAEATGWEVEVGPLCAVELPLFLGERWTI